jgi:hypothetical protein
MSSWRSLDEYSVAAFWAGDPEESEAAIRRLLANGRLPVSEIDRVAENLRLVTAETDRAETVSPAPSRPSPESMDPGESVFIAIEKMRQ